MLRAAFDDDRDLLLAWRNHPDVRRSSLRSHVIGADEHRRWWQTVRQDPTRRVLVYEQMGVPAGVVSFSDIDPVARSATWGFYLDVAGLQRTGQLLPAWLHLERDVVSYTFDDLAFERLGGETLAWNEPVLALHRRFGFREVRRYQRWVDGTAQEVVWTERRTGRRSGDIAADGSATIADASATILGGTHVRS